MTTIVMKNSYEDLQEINLVFSELLTEAQQAAKQSHNEAEQLRSKLLLKFIGIWFVFESLWP